MSLTRIILAACAMILLVGGLALAAPLLSKQQNTAQNTATDNLAWRRHWPPRPSGEHRRHPQPQPQPGTPNTNCSLVVPANPLSAQGLATPYLLTATDPAAGRCDEANNAQSAFVEATILDPATGALSVYHPLVINLGSWPQAWPVRPTLPANAVVGIWFGYNADTLTLVNAWRSTSLAQGQCVNGSTGSTFGQFAYCNAPAFFAAANTAIGSRKLAVPALGTAKDGLPCPTTRDFGVVDQDQSDNVTTTYLITAQNRVVQNTSANAARFANALNLANGSDNLLLDDFMDPAMGCTPWTAPDLTNNNTPTTSLALDELQAAADQRTPIALVPPNDPMTQVNGQQNIAKTNLYRQGVDQPAVNSRTDTAAAYCQQLETTGLQRLTTDKDLLLAGMSPDPAFANLDVFLLNRYQGSLGNLSCAPTTTPTTTSPTTSAGATTTTTTAPATSSTPTAPSSGTAAGTTTTKPPSSTRSPASGTPAH